MFLDGRNREGAQGDSGVGTSRLFRFNIILKGIRDHCPYVYVLQWCRRCR